MTNYKILEQDFVVGFGDGFQTTKLFRDQADPKNPRLLLEVYFNDVYKLLLKRLAMVESDSKVNDDELDKLEAVFLEFKKVKKMLVELPSADKNSD